MFLAGKFSGLDAAIAFPGDVDRERGVLEAVTDRIADDGIGNDLRPVSRGNWVVNIVDLPIERSSRISHRSCASVEDSFRVPMSSKISKSGRASLSR